MKDNRTELQKKFEQQTPTIVGVSGKEYLQTYCSWLELQIEKLTSWDTASEVIEICNEYPTCNIPTEGITQELISERLKEEIGL